MSRLRITMAGFDDEPALGGQGVVLAGMRRALRHRGVEVDTVAGRGEHAVPFVRVLRRPPLDLSLELNRHPEPLLRNSPQVVHAHGGPGGILLLRRLPVPLVYTAHHTYRQAHGAGSPRRLLSPLEGRAYRRAARVLAVSPSTADALKALGIPASRIEVLVSGVDVPAGIDDSGRDPGRLLFVGRLEPEKGVMDALTVMGDLVRHRPGVSAAIVGTGGEEPAVRRAALGTGVEVLGAVDRATLAEQYRRAAVVLMPSRYEGFGLVALEAMAAGAAVAAYDVEGLRDAVGGSGGGLLVPAGRPEALRAACADLLEQPGRRLELAARGREHVLAHHSWATVARRLEEVYRSLAAG